MERLLDLDSEGDFIGKKALLKIRDTGIQRRIVGVEILGEPLPQGSFDHRWPVFADDKIGEMLVALYSPRLEKNIGFAMVAIEFSNPGSSISVETPMGVLTAKVVEIPFVKPIKTQV